MSTNRSDVENIYTHFLTNVLPMFRANLLLDRYSADRLLQTHPNPLTDCGGKIYSQNDEDGITLEILRRLQIGNGVFAEFGVGSGLENNTLALVAAGWSGFWAGAEELAFNTNPNNVSVLNFHYQRGWIKIANIVELYKIGLHQIRRSQCDVISLDLDGNDYYFVDALLSAGASPKLFVVEYNAKFIPPILFKIDYDDDHEWKGDDYFGASLSSFAELFERHGYFLVCCNLTGANAFFVRGEYKQHFKDVPGEIEKLYSAPKYFLTGLDFSGHPTSLKTIENFFKRLNSGA
jgi:hypothetical protein